LLAAKFLVRIAKIRKKTKQPELATWGLHDLRRTARMLLSRIDARPAIAESCLRHVLPGL